MLVSCHQADLYDEAKAIGSQTEITSQQSKVIKSRSLPIDWDQLQTHDEMVNAVQKDTETLANLPTSELVEECVNYPLAFDCFLFNDFNHGLKVVLDNFNGYKELKTRDDAMSELLVYYGQYLQTLEYVIPYSEEEVDPFEYAFIELLIASGEFGDITQYPQAETLLNQSNNIRYRLNSLSGDICETIHSQLLKKVFGNKGSRTPTGQPERLTIYTKNGFAVTALKFTCESNSSERSNGLNLILNKYPKVEIVGDATCTYNCHGYAWYVSEGGEKYWINSGSDVYHPTNLSKFWEDGYYKECRSDEAEKVFYSNGGDHSAIVINENLYESKWGMGFLVRHAPDYCPYGTSRKYYAHNPSHPIIDPDVDPGFSGLVNYGTSYWNMTPDPTPLGSTELFWINDSWDSRFFSIEVYVSGPKEHPDPMEDTSRYTIVSSSHNNAEVTFHKGGTYYVCFKVTHKASGQMQALYTSQEVYVQ